MSSNYVITPRESVLTGLLGKTSKSTKIHYLYSVIHVTEKVALVIRILYASYRTLIESKVLIL